MTRWPDDPMTQFLSCCRLKFFSPLERLLDGAHHVKGLLGNIIALAFNQFFEAADCILEFHITTLEARELLRHVEGLGKEALDFARPRHCQFIFFRKLIDAED